VPSNPLLAEGLAAMANGDVEAARRHFRRLAAEGLPEAALALGSTYDPVSVERAGLASAEADRAQAKQWYRRAIELAQAATERRSEP
jgi:TPR repeat protein